MTPLFAVLSMLQVCPGTGYRLNESESCRFQAPVHSGSVCVSQAPQCGWAEGSWKPFSTSEKTVQFRFRVQSWKKSDFRLRWDEWRDHLSDRLRPVDSIGIYRKLLLNESVMALQDSLLRDEGWVHLVTASGIHLWALWSLLLAFSEGLAKCFKWPPRIQRRIFFVGLGMVVSYCLLLSGFRPGFLRPLALFLIRVLCRWNGIRVSGGMILLALAGWEACLFGFGNHGQVHYILAVAGTYLAAWSFQGKLSTWKKALWISWGSFVFVAFWDLLTEGRVAIPTLLLNFISFPVFVVCVYPLLLLFSVMASFGISCAGILKVFSWIDHGNQVAQVWVRDFPGWIWGMDEKSVSILSIGCLVLIPFLFLRRKAAVILISTVVFLGLRWGFDRFQTRSDGCECAIRIEALDVGQGDATWIQYQKKDGTVLNGLVDVGPERSWSSSRWLQFWLHRGIRQLDFIVLTHGDEDHVGGLRKLAKLMPIRCVVYPEEDRRIPGKLKLTGKIQREMKSECVPFPISSFQWNREGRNGSNDVMMAWAVPMGKRDQMMGFGDASQKLEKQALPWFLNQKYKSGTDAGRILWRGFHHGSKTSASIELLDRLRPDEVWVTSAWMGQYGHPHDSFLKALQVRGIAVKRGDQKGLLSWDLKSILY